MQEVVTTLSLWWFVPYGTQRLFLSTAPRVATQVKQPATETSKAIVPCVDSHNEDAAEKLELVVKRTCCCWALTHSWNHVEDVKPTLEPVCCWWGLLRFFVYFLSCFVFGMLLHMVPAQILTPEVSLGTPETHQALGAVWAACWIVSLIMVYVLRPRGLYIKGTWGRNGPCSRYGEHHESFVPLTTRHRTELLNEVSQYLKPALAPHIKIILKSQSVWALDCVGCSQYLNKAKGLNASAEKELAELVQECSDPMTTSYVRCRPNSRSHSASDCSHNGDPHRPHCRGAHYIVGAVVFAILVINTLVISFQVLDCTGRGECLCACGCGSTQFLRVRLVMRMPLC